MLDSLASEAIVVDMTNRAATRRVPVSYRSAAQAQKEADERRSLLVFLAQSAAQTAADFPCELAQKRADEAMAKLVAEYPGATI